MPYEAKIVSVEGRFGTVDIRVEYTNGIDTVIRDYNMHDPTQLIRANLRTFVRDEVSKLNTFETQVADIRANLVGVKIT